MEVEKLLTKYFCEANEIDTSLIYNIEWVRAKELITDHRIDLVAKLKYIELKDQGYDSKFIREVYISHIEAFSNGSFVEPGNEEKNSIEKYFQVFDELISDIKVNGMEPNISVVPVGPNNVILDGAHRTAIAAYYDLQIPIIRFEHLQARYDTDFFRQNLLSETYIDFLVSEYIKLKKNSYIACIWPRAEVNEENLQIKELISQYGSLVHTKSIKLSYDGLHQFISQIYSHQDWVGNIENKFAGAAVKAKECFKDGVPLNVYVIESESFERVLELKTKIRELFSVGNHSIHITDNQSESIQIANLLLNQNSIDFLNEGHPWKYQTLNQRLGSFKKSILSHNLDLGGFVIDSSTTLGLYGLREAGDVDFMTLESNFSVLENDYISNHHSYIHLYETTIDDLVLNPTKHFVYNDMKFITLKTLKIFKSNRKEPKDILDVKLIDGFLDKKKSIKSFLLKFQVWFNRKKRNMVFNSINVLRVILKKVGLFNVAKKSYHTLRNVMKR